MLLADAHNDLLMTFHSSQEIAHYMRFCQNNRVGRLFAAYYYDSTRDTRDRSLILAEIEQKFQFLDQYNIVTRTLENISFVKDDGTLRRIIKLQPFCATLTWNYANKLAGGAWSREGVSRWGAKVVAALTSNNILVDLAHLNERSFWEVADLQEPLFCSHTASFGVYPIKRNLSDAQLIEIGERHGFVGLCLYSSLLTKVQADHECIRRHLDKMLEFAGENCVGLGTDFNGTGEQNPKGFILDYSGMPALIEYLSKFYSKSVLNKVFYQNLIDFETRMRN